MSNTPFFFAWVAADETTFAEEHLRVDEHIFEFNLSQLEGDFATLTLVIENPRVGLLSAGRPVHAWFAYNPEWEALDSEPTFADVVPLFFGRIVAMPADLDAEVVTITLMARPVDYEDAKSAAAGPLRVRPYWDSIWYDDDVRDDPDNVLESRGALWHVDRVTHAVTVSNIINGEDGTLSYGEDSVLHDTVSVSYGTTPLKSVVMTATVGFNQLASGVMDLSSEMYNADGYSIESYTAQGIIEDFPKPGADLGGGWKIAPGTFARRAPPDKPAHYGYGRPGGTDFLGLSPDGTQYAVVVPPWEGYRFSGPVELPAHLFWVPKVRCEFGLYLAYSVSRAYTEVLTFTMHADVQDILTDAAGQDTKAIAMQSALVAEAIDPGGAIPLGRLNSSTYFTQDRGAESIEYLLMIARANLLTAARCVDVSFDIPWDQAIEDGITLRKNAAITYGNLPGGIAAGKLKSYSMNGNGDGGALGATLTIGCTIGKGGTVSASGGTPTYVEEGSVDREHQRYENDVIMPVAGEVTYTSINGLPADDDGINFQRIVPNDVVLSSPRLSGTALPGDMAGTVAEQEAAMGSSSETPDEVLTKLNKVQTKLTMRLRALNTGPFSTPYTVTVSALKIPKTIDLEAGESSS